jgi:hypothetical protein
MRRYMLGLLLAAGAMLWCGPVQAQFGPHVPVHLPNANVYGWSPYMWHPFKNAHRLTQQLSGGPKVYVPVMPAPTGGTLAFPTHPFARSPRDFFMEEGNDYNR